MEGAGSDSRKGRKRVTFKLVSASASDPRVSDNPWQRTLVLKQSVNTVFKNRGASPIPKDLLSLINPVDFGIHPNLSGPQKDALIAEIYGSTEEYERIAAKFEPHVQTHKPTDEELDDDCYFPKDGYDYSKHLATITPHNFIPAVKPDSSVASLRANLESRVEFPGLGSSDNGAIDNTEVAEVLKALEDSESDLEDIDDDFVAKAMDNDDPSTFIDENELLWGGYKPLLPAGLENLDLVKSPDGWNPQEQSEFMDDPCDYANDLDEDFDAEIKSTSLSALYEGAQYRSRYDEKITMDALDPDGSLKDKILQLAELPQDSDTDDDVEFPDSSDESEQWDVETVLTKYTNVTNHPQRILTNVVRKLRSSAPRESQEDPARPPSGVEYIELPQVVTTRRRGETPEEKRARKAAVKQAKAMITRMKKENKEALKDVRKKATEKTATGSYDIMNGVKYLRLK
ncbi:ribosomal protein L13, putative [Babesia ovis]|uniref:Ribosomal protein L13, putative n=1 Tax=Babesia ovis TaxID=5869 RepID=A0A9W5T9B6_BABOV|nr:ribosomal protein L13, putative [Babesia ovis]